MRLVSFKPLWVAACILIAACSSQRVVPESLEPLVDRTVGFRELLTDPESYQGRVVVLGGVILKAKRLKAGTQIELLQLPLDTRERPILDRRQSQGRFLAIQQEFLDPATIVEGSTMTIAGEVSGGKTDYLDDVEYRYPVVIIKHLHPWPAPSYDNPQSRPRFSIGLGGGTGVGLGGGGGFAIGF
ncbi:MAG: Slp family lipoprotein [Nitrospira sp.]|nr:Slp family lipoprotein [Nitrospira sp.]